MSDNLKKTLEELGLDPISADMYLLLVERGELRPKDIMTARSVSLSSVHNSLRELTSHDLISSRKRGRAVFYKAAHPRTLESLMNKRRNELQELDTKIDHTVSVLSKLFATTGKQPGMSYAEGEDAVISLLSSLLDVESDEPNYNIAAWDPSKHKEFTERVLKLIKARVSRGIRKHLLIPNLPEVVAFEKNLSHNKHTDVRLYDPKTHQFAGMIEIQGNRVLYVDDSGDEPVAFLIDNPAVAMSHKTLFQTIWEDATPLA